MTYQRFKEIWTALVTNRASSPDATCQAAPLNNGVSDDTVKALIEAADGNFDQFDKIDKELSARHA